MKCNPPFIPYPNPPQSPFNKGGLSTLLKVFSTTLSKRPSPLRGEEKVRVNLSQSGGLETHPTTLDEILQSQDSLRMTPGIFVYSPR
jgi:hypothetical protein